MGGDFNGEIGKLLDYPVEGSSRYDNFPNEVEYGFNTKRVTVNIESDVRGDELATFCIDNNMRILNGRFGNIAQTSDYTCIGLGKSILDYVMANCNLLEFVVDFRLFEKSILSDHRCMLVNLSITVPREPKRKKVKIKKLIWEPDKCKNVQENIEGLIPSLLELVNSNGTVDGITEEFSKKVIDCVFPIIGKTVSFFPKIRTVRTRCNKGKSDCQDCVHLKKAHLSALRSWHLVKDDINLLNNLRRASTMFNSHFRRCSLDLIRDNSRKIMGLKLKDSKKWWNAIALKKKHVSHGLSPNDFENHFRKVNNPEDNSDFIISPNVKEFVDNYTEVSGVRELECDITLGEIKHCVKKLANNTCPGANMWTNELLKNVESLYPVLLVLFNKF